MFRLKQRKVYSRSEQPNPDLDYETRLYNPVDLIRERRMSGHMCNLAVKNELVQTHNIRFTPGTVMLEDQEFTITCMVYSKNVLYFTKQNYMYYQRPGSLSKNEKTEQLPDIINCAMNVYRHAEKNLSKKELQSYKEYALIKCDQFLKAVFKDKNFASEDIQFHMDKFFETVNLPPKQRLLQTGKLKAIRTAKLMGI